MAQPAWRWISSSALARRRQADAAELVPARILAGLAARSAAYSSTEYIIIRVSDTDDRSWPTRPAECQVEP